MKTKDITLNITHRFKNYEHLVFASDNCFYQLEHFAKRTKPFRKLDVKIYKGGKSILFNREQIALTTLRDLSVKVFEFVKIVKEVCKIPF